MATCQAVQCNPAIGCDPQPVSHQYALAWCVRPGWQCTCLHDCVLGAMAGWTDDLAACAVAQHVLHSIVLLAGAGTDAVQVWCRRWLAARQLVTCDCCALASGNRLARFSSMVRADTIAAVSACCCIAALLQARGRVPGKTGVWVGERKIGAVGVRITHGISSHGIALNVTTDLSTYKHIVPCGTPDKEVTSVMQELHRREQAQRRSRDSSKGSHHVGDCTPGMIQQNTGGQLQQSQAIAPAQLLTAAEACLVSALARMLGLDQSVCST